ncbi:MAG: folate-binding protein YgfZ [Planctomycetota bacterium]|jgi:folate-binding protein YgfZ
MNHDQLCSTLLGNGSYAREEAPYKLLELAGPDAGVFLQRLCSQDVLSLVEGIVLPAAFLDAKGKLQFTVMVFRRGESLWLETQAEQVERLQALLERYHFSEQLAIHSRDLGAVHEHIAAGGSQSFVGESHWSEQAEGPVIHVERRGVAFTRCHGGKIVARANGGSEQAENVTPEPLTAETAEVARMLSGLVRVGVETEASTLALEANLDDHCSATKGCYTGQEIVARIHTYGQVNRKLCLLWLAGGDAISEPTTIVEPEDEIPVGRVMHAVTIAAQGMRLGLGYLPKDFQEVGTALQLEDGSVVTVAGF